MNLVTLIVGNPSTGKTTSLRNLKKNTFIINCERKELPFRTTSDSPYNYALGPIPSKPATSEVAAVAAVSGKEHMYLILEKINASDKFQHVVIDSFSAYTDMLLAECKMKYKGFDVFNNYNTGIYEFFQKLKELKNKFVFLISHVEYLQDADGNTVVRSKIKGKEWEGCVEKEATCVLYSRYIKKDNGIGVNYQFVTNSDGYLPGKTPLGMFDSETELYFENDLEKVTERYRNYYALDEKHVKINVESVV